MVAFILGLTISFTAVGLEELSFRRYPRFGDLVKLFYLAAIENFGYRQLNQYWRVRGVFNKIIGKKGWGKMVRKGFATEKKP
jgi:hypothetical protein